MDRRISWVEGLALAFIGVGFLLFMSRDMIADLAPTSNGSWLDTGGAAFGLAAVMGSIWFIAAGLSLLLVNPLLRLGSRAALWIALTGAVLGIGALIAPSPSVCHQWPIECEEILLAVPPIFIVFGIVVMIRRAQALRSA